jgi:hypothetical protein
MANQARVVENLKILPFRGADNSDPYVMNTFEAETIGKSVMVCRRYGPSFDTDMYFDIIIVGPRGAIVKHDRHSGIGKTQKIK